MVANHWAAKSAGYVIMLELVAGFVFGVLWTISVGMLLAGYAALRESEVELEGPRTHAHTLLLTVGLGVLFIWTTFRNHELFFSD
jgi:hypothetical protein